MQRFKAEAEEAFNNFSGDDDSYAGDEDDSFDGDEESFDGDDDDDFYTGTAGLDKIDPNDRILTFQIENTAIAGTDPSSLVAELFGAYKNLSTLNNGNPAGITVKLLESSYGQFLAETMSNPHLIKGLRYFVQNEIQLSNAMEMIEETSAGTTISKKYQPATKINPMAFRNNILLDNGFTMPVTGWVPAWFGQNRLVYKQGKILSRIPASGDVFGIYFASKRRLAHIGFVESWTEGKYSNCIEGNTSGNAAAGSEADRNGDGVYRKYRLKTQIHSVADYIGQ